MKKYYRVLFNKKLRFIKIFRNTILSSLVCNQGSLLCSIPVAFILFVLACNTQKSDDRVIARCFDYNLRLSEVKSLANENSSPLDSIAIVKNYIDNWTKQMAILAKAEQNLTDGQKNVEDELKGYRNSLIIYKYERELIRQQLDTAVTEEEIEKIL